VSVAASSDAAQAFEARAAWQSAIFLNAVVLFGALDRLVSETGVSSGEMTLRLCSMVFSSTILVALYWMRKAPRRRFALWAWIIGILPFLVMLPVMGLRWDAARRSWEPLFRQKLAAMVSATLAPPRVLVGMAGIGLIVVEVAVEWWLVPLRHSPYAWPGEPLRAFVYCAVAMAIAWQRGRELERERALVQREQEALVIERLARVALAVHDMTNTPLQTLVASAAIVEKDPTQSQRVAGVMLRAVEKLKTLNDALSTYQSQIAWRAGDEAFDPRAVIASAGQPAPSSPKRDS
jgi:hypothetical protein